MLNLTVYDIDYLYVYNDYEDNKVFVVLYNIDNTGHN